MKREQKNVDKPYKAWSKLPFWLQQNWLSPSCLRMKVNSFDSAYTIRTHLIRCDKFILRISVQQIWYPKVERFFSPASHPKTNKRTAYIFKSHSITNSLITKYFHQAANAITMESSHTEKEFAFLRVFKKFKTQIKQKVQCYIGGPITDHSSVHLFMFLNTFSCFLIFLHLCAVFLQGLGELGTPRLPVTRSFW